MIYSLFNHRNITYTIPTKMIKFAPLTMTTKGRKLSSENSKRRSKDPTFGIVFDMFETNYVTIVSYKLNMILFGTNLVAPIGI